jgi:hypothetical protein
MTAEKEISKYKLDLVGQVAENQQVNLHFFFFFFVCGKENDIRESVLIGS